MPLHLHSTKFESHEWSMNANLTSFVTSLTRAELTSSHECKQNIALWPSRSKCKLLRVLINTIFHMSVDIFCKERLNKTFINIVVNMGI